MRWTLPAIGLLLTLSTHANDHPTKKDVPNTEEFQYTTYVAFEPESESECMGDLCLKELMQEVGIPVDSPPKDEIVEMEPLEVTKGEEEMRHEEIVEMEPLKVTEGKEEMPHEEIVEVTEGDEEMTHEKIVEMEPLKVTEEDEAMTHEEIVEMEPLEVTEEDEAMTHEEIVEMEPLEVTEEDEEMTHEEEACPSESDMDPIEESTMDPPPFVDPNITVPPSHPFVTLLGNTLHSLTSRPLTLQTHDTEQILKGKTIIGLYFSAGWCQGCQTFTPELQRFYTKMTKTHQFQVIWISRNNDVDSYINDLSSMPWLALPIQHATGETGNKLMALYNVKSIPSLVLLDETAQVITVHGCEKMRKDRMGRRFPWRNPLTSLVKVVVPKSLRGLLRVRMLRVKVWVFQWGLRLLGRMKKQ